MAKNNSELRKVIFEILNQGEEFSSEENTPLDWGLFEHFGHMALSEAGFNGNAEAILHRIRNILEDEGWIFED